MVHLRTNDGMLIPMKPAHLIKQMKVGETRVIVNKNNQPIRSLHQAAIRAKARVKTQVLPNGDVKFWRVG